MNYMQLGMGLFIGLMATQTLAKEPWQPTDAEMASLPPFCKVKMTTGQGSPEYRTWEGILGRDFVHTHHYCAGINFINRYYRGRTAQDKRFNLNNARQNLQYMVTHADPSYSLMPDVYLNLGVVAALSNRPAEALTHFNKAIELNPNQPRAYISLADHYVKLKQTAKALEIVTEGLRHNPGTRSLQRRYTELGGKLPYPEPAVAMSETVPEPAPVVEAAPPDPAVAPPREAIAPPPPSTQTIGSPTNPYCRFCPD